MKDKLNFKPKEITKRLLGILAERNREVVVRRYGLGGDNKRYTLEAIGGTYKITRERVRQIENTSIAQIKKSPNYGQIMAPLKDLVKMLDAHGGVVHEQEFLETVTSEKGEQNHVHFLMVLSDAFTKLNEDEEFHDRWTTDPHLAERVHKSIRQLCQNFTSEDLISESELISRFLKELKGVTSDPDVANLAKKWLTLSKVIGKNPLGEWGLKEAPGIRLRGIRDWAYLVLRQEKKPLHFSEVAKKIRTTFGKPANAATCHNELIKDKRFVLVGRGLYALSEWGYQPGVVRDVIKDILKSQGPLTRDQIVKEVLKKRYVKTNTIIVNLQNKKYFKEDSKGRFVTA